MRFLHLAPAAKERAIRRSGLTGARAAIQDEAGVAVALARAVFAMPVVPDFWTSHQWTRELRRRSGERLVAVHFRLADDEPVHVGRFGQPHRLVTTAAAARWAMDNPDGAQVVVPRGIARREVVAVREAPQLVGWVQSTEKEDPFNCVCTACLPPGTPELMRRVRAAFRAGIDRARRAGDDEDELVGGLGDLQLALERARGRLAPEPVLAFARSPSPRVRREVAWLLRFFRPRQVEETLVALASDADEGVRENAVDGLLSVSGAVRAGLLLDHAPAEVRAKLAELVEVDASPLLAKKKRRRRG